jgi:calcium-dependent protein kinase
VLEKGHLSEQESMIIFKQILVCLSYCHSMGVTHRDLKPDNFMVTADLRVKLIDFGLSSEQILMTQKVGSPMYIAPEILTQSEYSEKCDLWSAGCILYFMLCGRTPFLANSPQEILQKVRIGKYRFDPEHWYGVSMHSQDLIMKLITPVQNRISAEQAL